MTHSLYENNLIPKNWVITKLEDICMPPQYGWTTSASKNGKIHLLRTTDITSDMINWNSVPYCSNIPYDIEKYLLKDGDIVISRAGSIGFSHLIKNPHKAIFASYLIRFKPLIFGEYLSYFLKSPKYWNFIAEKSSGISIPNVNASKLRQLDIPLPPLNEQKRIVSKLEELFTKLDAGIEYLKKTQIMLKQYRQSILKYAFEGKFTQKWRKNHGLAIQTNKIDNWEKERLYNFVKDYREFFKKNPNEKSLLPIEVKETTFQKPEEWIGITLESACTFVIDCPHSTPKFTNNGKYCIDTTCIKHSKIIWSEVRKVSEKEFKERIMRMKPREDDILFAREGTIGTTVKVPANSEFCLGQRIMMFRFAPFVLPQYAEFFMQSPVFIFQYRPLILGTSSPHLNVRDIRKLVIYVPTLEEQREIVKILDFKLSIIDNTAENINTNIFHSKILKKEILNNAFEGKLVPQDPNDEPAEILLQKIKQEVNIPLQKEKSKILKRKSIDNDSKQMRLM